ncbi:MAG: nitrophenyl compound nitroreductase subunit ArsF family protein [Bacteroidota bacterium]
MKRTVIFSLFLFLSSLVMAELPIPTSRVLVYYFHFAKQGKSGMDVENVSRNAVLALYPVKVKRNEFFFKSINLDDKDGAALGKKYGIKKTTLVVILDEKRVDLTKKAFKFATGQPDKLREEIRLAVESLLKQ